VNGEHRTPKNPDLTIPLKADIKALQEKKALAPKGFKGIIYKAQINKEINDKSKYIRSKENSRNLQEETIKLGHQI
jgi:hypothetical protein